jgi:prepilin-type N-terminal cleavage/methylation domain-containing protein
MLGGLQTSGQYDVARSGARRSFKMPYGFTVVEVMVVLAVTGMLFVLSASLIAGKQNRTAFDQAIRQVQAQIDQTINEVATGYYPNTGNMNCIASGGNVTLTVAGGTGQGANAGCVFAGKAVQFGIVGTDPEEFKVYSMAGLQKGGPGGIESGSLADARPKVIAPTSAAPTLPNSTVTETLQNGLTVTRMWYNDGGGDREIGAVAFTNSFAAYDTTTGAILSGSQRVDVVPIDDNNNNSKLGVSQTTGVEVINSRIASATANPSGGVFICFRSGSTDQSGLITIGNNNRQLSVKLDIKNGISC